MPEAKQSQIKILEDVIIKMTKEENWDKPIDANGRLSEETVGVLLKLLSNKRKSIKEKTTLCPRCGDSVSIFYFSSVSDEEGNKITPRCQNCGYFDDPE